MTRSQRTIHRVLWPVLAIAVASLFALALAMRAPPAPESPQAPAEVNR